MIIHNSHDGLFKHFLSDIHKAKDFLNIYLPNDIKVKCDFSTLQLKSVSFVEPDLRQHFSDILYSIKIPNSEGYFYILIEHETTPQRLTVFKLLRYQVAIMQRHVDQGHSDLPLV